MAVSFDLCGSPGICVTRRKWEPTEKHRISTPKLATKKLTTSCTTCARARYSAIAEASRRHLYSCDGNHPVQAPTYNGHLEEVVQHAQVGGGGAARPGVGLGPLPPKYTMRQPFKYASRSVSHSPTRMRLGSLVDNGYESDDAHVEPRRRAVNARSLNLSPVSHTRVQVAMRMHA